MNLCKCGCEQEVRNNFVKGHHNKGKKLGPLSEECKNKISLSNIGQVPWIKGKHHSPEAIEKIRQTSTGRKYSPESIERRRLAHMGIKPTLETLEKLRKSHLGQVAWNKGLTKENNESMKVVSEKNKIASQNLWKNPEYVMKQKKSKKDFPGTFIGHHHTEEARKKMSLSKKGKPSWNVGTKGMKLTPGFRGKHTEATRSLISQKLRGKTPWNKGKETPLNVRRKQSVAHKGINIWSKGQKMSEEGRENIRKSKTGSNNPNFGKPRSEKTRRKIGDANRGRHISEEQKIQSYKILREWHKNNPHPMKGKHLSDETKRKLRENTKNRKHSDETKLKIKLAWKDPVYVAKQMRSRHVKPNKLEKYFEKYLNMLYPNEWKFVGDGQLIINGKCPDFVNINGKKKLIEIYGDYWHLGQDPEERKKEFKLFGWNTLILWEKDVRKNPNLKNIIDNFIYDRKLLRRIKEINR